MTIDIRSHKYTQFINRLDKTQLLNLLAVLLINEPLWQNKKNFPAKLTAT